MLNIDQGITLLWARGCIRLLHAPHLNQPTALTALSCSAAASCRWTTSRPDAVIPKAIYNKLMAEVVDFDNESHTFEVDARSEAEASECTRPAGEPARRSRTKQAENK